MATSSENSEIFSLIRLLEDRDPDIRDKVSQRLIELGTDAIPFLEMAQREENLNLRFHIENILKRIAPRQIAEKFRELAKTKSGEEINLESAILLLMQYGHPNADPKMVTDTLDNFAKEFSSKVSLKEKNEIIVSELTKFLSETKGFKGNKSNYFDPDNSYFDTVIKNKTGIPISLSAIYILIGQRLNLPIVGIGLPGHFILKYNTPKNPIYFDPFNDGKVLSTKDCADLVRSFGIEFQEHYLFPLTYRDIIVRMMYNLNKVYQKNKEDEKAKDLENFIEVILNR